MSLLVSDRVKILSEATGATALHHVLFDRDEGDSFKLRLEAVRPELGAITRADVFPALPVGSRWTDAVGWESYVAYCLEAPLSFMKPLSFGRGRPELAVVGLEYVMPHETRVAYPVFAGAVLQVSDVAAVLTRIATGLDPDEEHQPPLRCVLRSDATSPQEHRGPTAALLRAAATAFAAGKRPLLRTAILSEDEVPPKLMILTKNVILGTVPSLLRNFSSVSRFLLR
jgi:hypothetical protein